MALDSELLEILRCPTSHARLRLLTADERARVNERIAAGAVRNAGGQLRDQPLEDGLITEDGAVIYPIEDAIPVLLVEEGIPWQAGST